MVFKKKNPLMVIIRHSHGWFLRMVKVSFPILETIIGFWIFFPVAPVTLEPDSSVETKINKKKIQKKRTHKKKKYKKKGGGIGRERREPLNS